MRQPDDTDSDEEEERRLNKFQREQRRLLHQEEAAEAHLRAIRLTQTLPAGAATHRTTSPSPHMPLPRTASAQAGFRHGGAVSPLVPPHSPISTAHTGAVAAAPPQSPLSQLSESHSKLRAEFEEQGDARDAELAAAAAEAALQDQALALSKSLTREALTGAPSFEEHHGSEWAPSVATDVEIAAEEEAKQKLLEDQEAGLVPAPTATDADAAEAVDEDDGKPLTVEEKRLRRRRLRAAKHQEKRLKGGFVCVRFLFGRVLVLTNCCQL